MIIWGLYAFWGGVCIKKLVTEMSPVKTWIASRDSQRRFTLCSSSRGVEWQRNDVAIQGGDENVDCFPPRFARS